MIELSPGVWWWEAVHPEWTDEDAATEDWGPEVSSYAFDDGERLLLVDPTLPPAPVAALARERETAIVLTCPWHARDTARLVAQLGAPVFSPRPDTPAEAVAGAQLFAAGDPLPGDVEAWPGMEPSEVVLWLPAFGALVAGDALIDRGSGLELPRDWAARIGSVEEIHRSLRRLLELPVQHVLPTHGAPTDRATLERALA